MKAIKYELRIIHKKEIVIGSIDRKRIEEALQTMLQSKEEMDVSNDELVGVIVEEKGERDCPGVCESCPYLCPKDEDCMMDDLENRCVACEFHCKKCANCRSKNYGTCGEACEKCGWRCQECGGCTHPEGEKLP